MILLGFPNDENQLAPRRKIVGDTKMVNHGCFFTTDIGPGTTMQQESNIRSRPIHRHFILPTNPALTLGFMNSFLQDDRCIELCTTNNRDGGGTGMHRIALQTPPSNNPRLNLWGSCRTV